MFVRKKEEGIFTFPLSSAHVTTHTHVYKLLRERQ